LRSWLSLPHSHCTRSLRDALPISTKAVPRPAAHHGRNPPPCRDPGRDPERVALLLVLSPVAWRPWRARASLQARASAPAARERPDRKSTSLNYSHQIISYVVFCLE